MIRRPTEENIFYASSMATKDITEPTSKSSAAIKQRSADLTECSICTELFDSPRCLPCIHTFCLKCLKEYGKNKVPGSQMPCPVCRQSFTIPTAGFEGLSKNFFVEHLMTIKSSSSVSESKADTVCDLCSDDDDGYPSATGYCVECRLNLCVKCFARHKKLPFAKTHNIVTLKEKQTSPNLTKLHMTYCEKHPEEQLKLFCYTCKVAVCLMCFAVNHNGHKCADINEAAKTFRTQIEGRNQSNMTSCITETEKELQKLDAETSHVVQQIVSAKEIITKKSNELKSRIDSEEMQLNEQLNSYREKRLRQIEGRRADLNLQLATMKSFIEYSNKLLDTGSACDISRSANDIISRRNQLVTSQTKFNSAKLLDFNVSYDGDNSQTATYAARAFNPLNSTSLLGMITLNGKQVSASQSKLPDRIRPLNNARVCPHGCRQQAASSQYDGYGQPMGAINQSYSNHYQMCIHGVYQSQCQQCKAEPVECFHGYELRACPSDCISQIKLCVHGLQIA